jgi:hypothetical protein
MIKQMQAFVALTSISTVAFAQGTVEFSPSLLGPNARVTKADGTFAAGSAFLAQLYWQSEWQPAYNSGGFDRFAGIQDGSCA